MDRRGFLWAGAVTVLTALAGKVRPATETYSVWFDGYTKVGDPILLPPDARIWVTGNTIDACTACRGVIVR